MKIVLMSMPDITPVVMHEAAFHLPNNGIASIGANVDDGHEVYIIDLIRKRWRLRRYLEQTLGRIRPDLVGLSTMTWQYDTCLRLIRFIRAIVPGVKIAIGGYHPTLMSEEIAASEDGASIDFIVRGEGEEPFRRLVNALDGKDRMDAIPSLSFRNGSGFTHNPRGELLDLSRLKLPIRDARRLTGGYHAMNAKIEVIETSRGCTRSCNFCSIRHMYGRRFRPFPVERVLADLDDIYFNRNTRWVFVSDDNMVLVPQRVMELCDAIIARRYPKLRLIVQADCITMAENEPMVQKMAEAGLFLAFLGVENASTANLAVAEKKHTAEASRRAVDLCHRYGIATLVGMIFGFPDDDEAALAENYRFLKSLGSDTDYCQILTPYPKTGLRQTLLDQELVTNPGDFSRYNGIWANVRTRHLDAERLQYLYWYLRETILGWWEPSARMREKGRIWTGIWLHAMRPILQKIRERQIRRLGWERLYEKEMARKARINRFPDLDGRP